MRRLAFLAGHFGSGKSEVAVNLALRERTGYLVDLDIVNPYFRSREAIAPLSAAGIRVVSSPLREAAYADMPYLSKDVFLPFYDHHATALFDLGGNDLGALLLRQFEPLAATEPVDLLLVVNVFRPETQTAEAVVDLIATIEKAGGIPVTGLVNNANLLRETTYAEILQGEAVLRAVAQRTGLPIVLTCIEDRIYDPAVKVAGEPLVLTLKLRQYWL